MNMSVVLVDVLRFDNTYSWTRSKELFYTVRVLPPDTEICDQEEEVKDDLEFADCTEVTEDLVVVKHLETDI